MACNRLCLLSALSFSSSSYVLPFFLKTNLKMFTVNFWNRWKSTHKNNSVAKHKCARLTNKTKINFEKTKNLTELGVDKLKNYKISHPWRRLPCRAEIDSLPCRTEIDAHRSWGCRSEEILSQSRWSSWDFIERKWYTSWNVGGKTNKKKSKEKSSAPWRAPPPPPLSLSLSLSLGWEGVCISVWMPEQARANTCVHTLICTRAHACADVRTLVHWCTCCVHVWWWKYMRKCERCYL